MFIRELLLRGEVGARVRARCMVLQPLRAGTVRCLSADLPVRGSDTVRSQRIPSWQAPRIEPLPVENEQG